MNYKIINNIFFILFVFIITGCSTNKKLNIDSNGNLRKDSVIMDKQNEVIDEVKVLIDNNEYNINLEDNETAKTFVNMLPQEYNMNELNGNEKYVYLNSSLPVDAINVGYINAGDVMLYGDNCLVIFYKSFKTSYSYTKIGHIDNLDDLGNGSINIKIVK